MGRPRKYQDVNRTCLVCESEFTVRSNSQKKICSRKCTAEFQTGINNPNYNNKWSSEQVAKQSDLMKNKYDEIENYRFRVGASNRGKKFLSERIAAMHKNRPKSSYSHPHTEETKAIIGKKSSEKWTEEYRVKYYKNGVISGRIVADELRSDFEIYQQKSHWIQRMWDLVEDSKIVELGIFNAVTNPSGCVRDHRLSKMDGFKLGIFPEILRHPVNCNILTHSQNASKREKSSILVKELFDNIKKYDKIWVEHELVLSLITRWENGERFSAQDYRRKSS
jgi:hypothetical protein